MEKLKHLKESLIGAAQSQVFGNLQDVDAKELGEVIDMIKDLDEAMYYCSVVKAMEESNKEEQKYYTQKYLPMYRDMDYADERMYYGGQGGGNSQGSSNNSGGNRYYSGQGGYGGTQNSDGGRNMPNSRYYEEMRDMREGRSPMMRRNYMESKSMHKGQEIQKMELERYMQELGHDITEMISDASIEEKQMLKQKMSELIGKIN